MYNYNHLYYFYTTVKSGSITSAAKHLSISQPSLSSQLKVLEEFLQIKLFNRIGRKNELTGEGAVIFGFCRQMFELSEEMHESITEKIPYASRRIYIGVSHEIANSFIVEIISHFLKKYNSKLRPKVMMISGTHEKLVEQLRFREIDIVFTQQSITSPEIETLKKIDVPVNLICITNNKISPKKRYSQISDVLNAINQETSSHWVMPTVGLKLRGETDKFFEHNSIQGRVVFESDVIESLVRSVVDRIGIAFLPLIYIPKEMENKSLYSFGPKKGYWQHSIFLASHSKNIHDHLVQSLAHSFTNVCKPLISR